MKKWIFHRSTRANRCEQRDRENERAIDVCDMFSFEKMISGMYMGEIVRLIILDLLQQELLFLGHRDTYSDYKTPLYNRGGFYTKFVSTVETDEGQTNVNKSNRIESK